MPNGNTIRKTIGFAIFSLATGALYVALLFLFDSIMKLPFVISVTLSYSCAMLFYFFTNKLMIFKTSPEKNVVKREIIQFIILIILNYLITLGIVSLIRLLTGEVYSGSLLAGIFTIILTYFIFERYIFSKRNM